MGEIVKVRLFSDPEKEAEIFIPRKCSWESLTSVIATRLGLKNSTIIQYLILCNRENYPLGDVVTDTETFWGLFWHYRPEDDMAFLVRTNERVSSAVIEQPVLEDSMFQKSLASLMESMDNQNQLWSRVGLQGIRDEEDDTTAETSNTTVSSSDLGGAYYAQNSSIINSVSGISNDRMYDQMYNSETKKFNQQNSIQIPHSNIPSNSSSQPQTDIRYDASLLRQQEQRQTSSQPIHQERNDHSRANDPTYCSVPTAMRPIYHSAAEEEDEEELVREAEEQRRRAEAEALQRLAKMQSRQRITAAGTDNSNGSSGIDGIAARGEQGRGTGTGHHPVASLPSANPLSHAVNRDEKKFQMKDEPDIREDPVAEAYPSYAPSSSRHHAPPASAAMPVEASAGRQRGDTPAHEVAEVNTERLRQSEAYSTRPSSDQPSHTRVQELAPSPSPAPVVVSAVKTTPPPVSIEATDHVPEACKVVRIRLGSNASCVSRDATVSVSADCDWTELTRRFSKALGLLPGVSVSDMVLLDEDGDETSGSITDDNKFWKFYSRRYRPQEDMVFLVRVRPIPDSRTVPVVVEGGEGGGGGGDDRLVKAAAEEAQQVVDRTRLRGLDAPLPLPPSVATAAATRETPAPPTPSRPISAQDEADRRAEALAQQRAEAQRKRALLELQEEEEMARRRAATSAAVVSVPPVAQSSPSPHLELQQQPQQQQHQQQFLEQVSEKMVVVHCRLSSDPPPTHLEVELPADASWDILAAILGRKFHLTAEYVVDKIALIDEDGDDVFGIISTAPRFWKAVHARYRADSMTFIAYVGPRPASSPTAPTPPSMPTRDEVHAPSASTGTTSGVTSLRSDSSDSGGHSTLMQLEQQQQQQQAHYPQSTYTFRGDSTQFSSSTLNMGQNLFEPAAPLATPSMLASAPARAPQPHVGPMVAALNAHYSHQFVPVPSSSSNHTSHQQSSPKHDPMVPRTQGTVGAGPHMMGLPSNTNTMLPPVYNPNSELPDPNRVAAFLKACSDGDLMAVKQMTSSGIDVNVRDPIGLTAMHVVCIMGRAELAQWLLQHGASFSSRDKEGMTPLHYACDNKHVQLALLLVRNGADSSLRNKAGITSLHIICIRGVMELTQLIRDYMINVATGSGLTLLHCAADQGHLHLVQYLCAHGAQPHARDDDGMTPLHLACMAGHVEVCRALIDMGAYWNARDDEGMSPLLYACQEAHFELVLMLMDCNANIYARNNAGATALHLACDAGSLDVVAALLERNLDCDVRRKDGLTSFHLAQKSGNPDLVHYLSERGIGPLQPEQDAETALRVQVENKAEAAIRAFEAEEEANLQMELMARAAAAGNVNVT